MFPRIPIFMGLWPYILHLFAAWCISMWIVSIRNAFRFLEECPDSVWRLCHPWGLLLLYHVFILLSLIKLIFLHERKVDVMNCRKFPLEEEVGSNLFNLGILECMNRSFYFHFHFSLRKDSIISLQERNLARWRGSFVILLWNRSLKHVFSFLVYLVYRLQLMQC